MVHKHACQLLPHGLRQQGSAHGAIHAAGQRQQHPAAAHFFPDGGNSGFLVVLHGPVARRTADLIEKISDHRHSVFCMIDLRMVLHTVKSPLHIGNCHIGAGLRVGCQNKSLGNLLHVVPMAHPANALFRQSLEKRTRRVKERLCLPILPSGVLLGGSYLSPQGIRHKLAAIADPQHRDPQPEYFRVRVGCILQIDRVGSTGKNEPDGIHSFQFLQGGGKWLYLAVNTALSDSSGNQLIVLTAEIQHNDHLMRQNNSSFFTAAILSHGKQSRVRLRTQSLPAHDN